jgi:photosystem II stability/assembly factor-like uncharacterized protein
MRLERRTAVASLLAIIALTSAACKNAQNSNQQNSNQSAGKPIAYWIPQWRSPYSQGFAGTNLGAFAYSSISVVSPSVVFVAGEMPNPKDQTRRIGVVVHTTNGGEQWTETLLDKLAARDTVLNSIHFVNASTGWIVGAASGTNDKLEGILLRTTDGGANWALSKTPFKQIPSCVFFTDENTGWMAGVTPTPEDAESEGGPSDILKTTDAGRTWQSQRRLSTSINDIFFVDKDTGWACGYKGAVYKTTDGGELWSQQRSEIEFNEHFTDPNSEGAQNFAIWGIHFADAKNGLAAAGAVEDELGRILGTTAGGAPWARKLIAQGEGIRDVFLLSPTEGWAAPKLAPYIYHTVDGGHYWESERVVFEQEVPLFRVAAADDSHAWAVGGGAIFYRVPSGGVVPPAGEPPVGGQPPAGEKKKGT